MSYSFNGYFRTKQSAIKALRAASLPAFVEGLVGQAIDNLEADSDDRFLHIKADGHQCYAGPGGGSYQRSSADIVVEPLFFLRSES